MRTLWSLIACGILLLFVSTVRADKVDDFLRAEMKQQQIPGASLSIIRNGNVIKRQGYGIANLEHQVPATTETVYELASLSKQFTAVAVMMLVEEGKIGLDDSIRKYLEDTPNAWQPVTVRHLLNHTAGFVEFYFNLSRLSADRTVRPYTRPQQLEDIAHSTLLFTPGEKFGYSNTGYQLLGMIVEKASGKRFEEFLTERVLVPLGMRSTRFLDAAAIIPHHASGYTLRQGKLAHHSLTQVIGALSMNAFGGLLSDVRDLEKWNAVLDTSKLLKAATLEQMWTSAVLKNGQPTGYGFGFDVLKEGKRRVIMHTGHTGTAIVRVPESGLTVILLTNLGMGNPAPFGKDGPIHIGTLALKVAALYDPALLESQEKGNPATKP